MKTMSALRVTATIGAAIVLALLTVQGTLALWNATATSKAQTVQSADFNVMVAVGDKEAQRLPAGGTVPGIILSGLKRGTQYTTPIVVTNATNAGGPFTISAAATVQSTGELAPYLVTSIGLGQGGRCDAPTPGHTVGSIQKDTSTTFCLSTTLKRDTPASIGGAGASVAFILDTQQQSR